MTHCSWCGDPISAPEHEDCWVRQKIANQEDIPAPERVGEQIDPFGRPVYVQP